MTGSVVGFQYLENPIWSKAKQPKEKGYSFREVVPTVPAKYRRLYPAIEKELCIAASGKAKQPAMKDVIVAIGGGRATPVTLVVTPGTKLIFKNKDPFKHRLYGVGINTFTAADSEKGSSREWTVAQAGRYEIRDERAPSLRVWVIADETIVSSAYPQPSGAFELSMKRPGAYEVQAYFSGEKVGDAQIAKLRGKTLKLKPLQVAKEKKEKTP
jgi:plastocyanin